MKVVGKEYCDVSKVYIAQINKKIAKRIIVERHYTHAWTSCRYALGVYYRTEETVGFGNDRLIGCVIYGFPVGARAATSICEGLTKDNALELTRLYVDDGYGSNIESYVLSLSFKWLKENDPNIKLLISYADSGQRHLGSIYQATNWIYQGLSTDIALMPNYEISLTKEPFDWIHSRTVFSIYGSTNLEHLRKEIGKQGYKEFWRKRESAKHRYIQILAQNKREKRDLFKKLKHELKEYPKNADIFIPEVEHYTTTYERESVSNFW